MKPTDIFIFGSNLQGFHGAGTAGFAMRGDSANNWRSDDEFLTILKHGNGTPGKRAVLGVAKGYQEGTEGCSYAIATCTKPGARLSVSVADIRTQAIDLLLHIRANPDRHYLLTPFGCGYSGHSAEDMRPMWKGLLAEPNCEWAPDVPASIKDNEPPNSFT